MSLIFSIVWATILLFKLCEVNFGSLFHIMIQLGKCKWEKHRKRGKHFCTLSLFLIIIIVIILRGEHFACMYMYGYWEPKQCYLQNITTLNWWAISPASSLAFKVGIINHLPKELCVLFIFLFCKKKKNPSQKLLLTNGFMVRSENLCLLLLLCTGSFYGLIMVKVLCMLNF